MRHSLFSRALSAGALGIAAIALAAPALAAVHGAGPAAPQPRSGGSTVTNSVTSNSSSNCVSGTEPGCATSVVVEPRAPTVNPGPFPAAGPIDGAGTPGDPIDLTEASGHTVCTAKVLADGAWKCTPANPRPPGTEPLTPVDTSVSPHVPGTATEVTFESSAVTVSVADPGAAAVLTTVGLAAVLLWRRRRAAVSAGR